MSLTRLFVPIAAVFWSGCSVLTSETFDQIQKDNRAPRGVTYSLPKGIVDVILTVAPDTAQYTLDIANARSVPDPDHTYVLNYQPDPRYSDVVSITTTKDGLLETVNSTTKDQTPGIILNLAKAAYGGGIASPDSLEAVKFESSSTPPIELLKLTIDPLAAGQRQSAISQINAAIVAFRDTMRQGCGFYAKGKTTAAGQSRSFYEGQLLSARASKPLLDEKKKTYDGKLTAAKAKLFTVLGLSSEQPEQVISEDNLKNIGLIECASTPSKQTNRKICAQSTQPTECLDTVKAYCTLTDQHNNATLDAAAIDAAITDYQGKLTELLTDQSGKQAQCRAYVGMNHPPRAHIDVSGVNGEGPQSASLSRPMTALPRQDADCTIGVCYRPKEPFRIEYSVGTGKASLIAELPNEADIVAIDIRRAFLVQKVQNISFADGYLTRVQIDKKSELLAASKIPVDVLEAIGTSLQLRIAATEKKTALANDELALLRAHADTAAAKAAAPKSPASLPTGFESGVVRTVRPARHGATSGAIVP